MAIAQDTILANRGRQYFEDCYIAGHVDFIFGAATVFFEKCHIHCLRNGYITAASTPSTAKPRCTPRGRVSERPNHLLFTPAPARFQE